MCSWYLEVVDLGPILRAPASDTVLTLDDAVRWASFKAMYDYFMTRPLSTFKGLAGIA